MIRDLCVIGEALMSLTLPTLFNTQRMKRMMIGLPMDIVLRLLGVGQAKSDVAKLASTTTAIKFARFKFAATWHQGTAMLGPSLFEH